MRKGKPMLELPPELEDHLRKKAARNGLAVTDYLWQIVGEMPLKGDNREMAGNADRPRESDPFYLRSLPKEERDRIMEAQCEAAAPLYEADLALPVEQRELTAWL